MRRSLRIAEAIKNAPSWGKVTDSRLAFIRIQRRIDSELSSRRQHRDREKEREREREREESSPESGSVSSE